MNSTAWLKASLSSRIAPSTERSASRLCGSGRSTAGSAMSDSGSVIADEQSEAEARSGTTSQNPEAGTLHPCGFCVCSCCCFAATPPWPPPAASPSPEWATTSRCSLTGTVNSPSCLSGSASWILRLSIVEALARRAPRRCRPPSPTRTARRSRRPGGRARTRPAPGAPPAPRRPRVSAASRASAIFRSRSTTLHVARRRRQRQLARQQVVARVAVGDLHDVAAPAEVLDVITKNDFHGSPPSPSTYGQQRQLPRPLDGRLQLALVHRAHARDAPRQDLRRARARTASACLTSL